MTLERIKIDYIVPNPHQYREIFDDESIKELARSYGGKQPTQPPTVYPWLSDEFNLIIAGERRWRAAKLAGLEWLDCIVRRDLVGREPDDPEILGLGALENIQRKDMTPMETANMIAKHRKRTGLSQKQLAAEWSKNESWIERYESLTKLAPCIMHDVNAGMVSATIGFQMARIKDTAKQEKAYQAMKQLGMVNTVTAQRIVDAVNLAPDDIDFKELVREFGRAKKVSAGKKKKQPKQELNSDELIEEIVTFHKRLDSINPDQIPSSRNTRINAELDQVLSAINSLSVALGEKSEQVIHTCDFCKKEMESDYEPEGSVIVFFRGKNRRTQRGYFCCAEHLSEWLKTNPVEYEEVEQETKPTSESLQLPLKRVVKTIDDFTLDEDDMETLEAVKTMDNKTIDTGLDSVNVFKSSIKKDKEEVIIALKKMGLKPSEIKGAFESFSEDDWKNLSIEDKLKKALQNYW